MRRTIKYRGIKEVVYFLSQYELRDIAIQKIEKDSLFTRPALEKKSSYSFEWVYNDQDEADGMRIVQKIIEEERDETT